MILRVFFGLLALVVAAGLIAAGVYAYQSERYALAHPPSSFGPKVTIQLRRGPFTVYNYLPKGKPRAIILFGSGDGGWLGWEDTVGKGLSRDGYQVIGIDSSAYAQTDYDLATLQADFDKIIRTFLVSYWYHAPPILIGGWSMGAAQAVAVAGGPNPPPELEGMVVASLVPRGRYGIRLSDRMDIPPMGQGTFSMVDFAGKIRNIRIVQIHGAEDIIDSRSWLNDLKVPHEECDVPNAGHPFNGADDDFLKRLADSVRWASK